MGCYMAYSRHCVGLDSECVCPRDKFLLSFVNGRTRLILTVVTIVVASVVFILYLSLSPYGGPPLRCGIKNLTGFDCPGCGSQRAFQALLHGDFASAWGYNAFALLAAPVAVFLIVVEAGREYWPRLHRRVLSKWTIVASAVAIIGWWIIRNHY